MTDVEREKYARPMSDIEQLEELRASIADRMRQLARVTDGCTRPRASG
jgi:hypothetical protein